MDRAKRNLEILFSPWYSSSFFFFSKPTAFSFIGGNSWSQRICLEAPHYRTLHIEKASSMYSSTALNTFNYPFRGSALSHLNSVCTVAHNRSLLISGNSFYSLTGNCWKLFTGLIFIWIFHFIYLFTSYRCFFFHLS